MSFAPLALICHAQSMTVNSELPFSAGFNAVTA
jgi:hypothetical protein